MRLVREGNFYTNDIVEIRGCLGIEDSRELKVNGRPPLSLDTLQHTILLILANFARYVALRAQAPGKHAPAFLSVKSIVAIIDELTGTEGSLAGRWPGLTFVDVYRSVSELRGFLFKAHGNPNLLESGPRGAGYRVSTPAANLILNGGQEPKGTTWAALFDRVLFPKGGGSGDDQLEARKCG